MTKNIVIIAIEIVSVLLMALGLLPVEFSIALTGLLVVYFIFSSLSDCLWVFIASLPLFVALPLSNSFDTMSNWRILLSVMFLVWFFRKFWGKGWRAVIGWFKSELKNKTISLVMIFLFIGLLSLFVSQDKIIGLKKIAFFVNIGLVFFVAKEVASKREGINKIFQATGVALGIILVTGYGQLISTMFVPLHVFWKSWASQVINLFYGNDLAHLLSFSNTWFSYYSGAPPTLRMFSVFPDSHSFALFLIIGLIYLLTLIFVRRHGHKKRYIFNYFSLIAIMLALIFAGSRGIWVSALMVLVGLLILIPIHKWLIRGRDKARLWLGGVGQAKVSQLVLGTLLVFFALFPIATTIQFFAQDYQWGTVFARASSITDFSELSVRSRLQIWEKTIESIYDRPILGVGIGNFPTVLAEDIETAKMGSSAHNLYMDIAAEMGLAAMILFMAIAVQIISTCWRLWKRNKNFIGVYGLVFMLYFGWILCYSLFDVVLFNDKVLLFFVISLAILYGAGKSTHINKHNHL